MSHPHFPYTLLSLALAIVAIACAAPQPSKKNVAWDEISHGVEVHKTKPYQQSGFGDCDAKDLIHFTCE